MILKRILIVLGIGISTSLISAGLLLLGHSNQSNKIDIYEEENITEESEIISQDDKEAVVTNDKVDNVENKSENIIENVPTVAETEKQIVNNEISSNNEVDKKEEQIIVEEKEQNIVQESQPVIVEEKKEVITQVKEEIKESEKQEIKQEVKEEPKEDVYTFKRNDAEIQNMISIAKRIIKENKNNRCDGLVDKIDSINFVISKAGNLFYPLFDYRIENIVIDNFYPEFYVYAEDIYLNGEYLRTEYYFN